MDRTTLRLSQEELLFALRTVGEGMLPGMGSVGLDQADATQLEALAQAGGRALMARGLITTKDDGQLTLDRGLYSLVTICAHPAQMVSLFASGDQIPPHQTFYYRVDELAITHTPRAYGIHQFEIVASSDLGKADIERLLAGLPALDAAATAAQPLRQTALLEAQLLAPSDRAAATAGLAAAGMELAAATALAQTLAAAAVLVVVQFMYQFSPAVEQTVLKLVAGAGGCWLIIGERVDTAMVSVMAVTAAQAREQVLQRFEPLNAAGL